MTGASLALLAGGIAPQDAPVSDRVMAAIRVGQTLEAAQAEVLGPMLLAMLPEPALTEAGLDGVLARGLAAERARMVETLLARDTDWGGKPTARELTPAEQAPDARTIAVHELDGDGRVTVEEMGAVLAAARARKTGAAQ